MTAVANRWGGERGMQVPWHDHVAVERDGGMRRKKRDELCFHEHCCFMGRPNTTAVVARRGKKGKKHGRNDGDVKGHYGKPGEQERRKEEKQICRVEASDRAMDSRDGAQSNTTMSRAARTSSGRMAMTASSAHRQRWYELHTRSITPATAWPTVPSCPFASFRVYLSPLATFGHRSFSGGGESSQKARRAWQRHTIASQQAAGKSRLESMRMPGRGRDKCSFPG